MAMPIDRLKSLPPELRLYVYSHLLSDDGHSTVWISQRRKTEKSSPYAESLSAVLASRGTRAYAAYRRRKLMFGNRQGSDRWSDEVEEAFFQGTRIRNPDIHALISAKSVSLGRRIRPYESNEN